MDQQEWSDRRAPRYLNCQDAHGDDTLILYRPHPSGPVYLYPRTKIRHEVGSGEKTPQTYTSITILCYSYSILFIHHLFVTTKKLT